MCVVSMIMDDFGDKWNGYVKQTPIRYPTQEEIDEFYRLLNKAREYDKKNNQPDCGIEEKKKRLQRIADELGIKIKFD